MADVHYFRPPFPRRALKRGRDHDDDDEEENDKEQSSQARRQKQDQPPDKDNLEEAPDEKPADFPHAPLKTGELKSASHKRNAETVRRRHTAVLTTILHKCMLDGDYIRAGRAFSMLLRLEMGGVKIDVRKDGLWGIGAEILLRRETAIIEDATTKFTWFSQEGFRAARAYYDRLILQFPHRKTHPYLMSSIHFNVAMFGVWIFQIQDRSRSLSYALENGSSTDDILAVLGGTSSEDDNSTAPDVYQLIKESELEQARDIQNHIEHVTLGPPFDKDPQHHKLQGMISLWIVDLLRTISRPKMEVDSELKKASSHFKLCTNNGGTVWTEAELAAQPVMEEEEQEREEEAKDEEKEEGQGVAEMGEDDDY